MALFFCLTKLTKEKLKSLIKGTTLENFVLVHDIESLKKEIHRIEPKNNYGIFIVTNRSCI